LQIILLGQNDTTVPACLVSWTVQHRKPTQKFQRGFVLKICKEKKINKLEPNELN